MTSNHQVDDDELAMLRENMEAEKERDLNGEVSGTGDEEEIAGGGNENGLSKGKKKKKRKRELDDFIVEESSSEDDSEDEEDGNGGGGDEEKREDCQRSRLQQWRCQWLYLRRRWKKTKLLN